MGSCISKCKPKNIKPPQQPRIHFNNLIQDKLINVVIPQPPPPPPPLTTTSNPTLSLNNKISPYPPPSPSPSISSLTCLSSSTTTTTTNTSFSTATSRSPEYSRPRYNQHPHVVRINSLKASAFLPPAKPVSPLVRYPSPQRVQKRVRPASPSPVRQKSFRKEERPPSSSRRLSGEKCRVAQRKGGGTKRELPVRDFGMRREISRIHRISSKIDEVGGRELGVLNDGDFDSVVTMEEDIDNPLISLDCFIFL